MIRLIILFLLSSNISYSQTLKDVELKFIELNHRNKLKKEYREKLYKLTFITLGLSILKSDKPNLKIKKQKFTYVGTIQ